MYTVVIPFGAGKVPFCLRCGRKVPQDGTWVLFADHTRWPSTKLFCAPCYVHALDHQLHHDPSLVVGVIEWVSDDDDGAP